MQQAQTKAFFLLRQMSKHFFSLTEPKGGKYFQSPKIVTQRVTEDGSHRDNFVDDAKGFLKVK